MLTKITKTKQKIGVVSGKFTGDVAMDNNFVRAVASPAGCFKFEKKPEKAIALYEDKAILPYSDKRNRALVPIAGMLVVLLVVSVLGTKSLSFKTNSGQVANLALVSDNTAVPFDFNKENVISNIKVATNFLPQGFDTGKLTASVFSAVGDFFNGFWILFQSMISSIVDNWKKFLGLAPADKSDSVASLTPELQAQLKKEITDELYNRLMAGEPPATTSSFVGNKTAIMISPSTGASSSDEAIKQKIKDMFSDKVDISFDPSGNSGVVTPRFSRNKNGSNYVFVLTPLR